jgi:DNA-binding MarR family transcriptional regulator
MAMAINMTYLETHPLRGAFVSNKFVHLTDLIAAQGEELLRDANINVPSRAVSIVLLIGEHGEISAADIANLLRQPHQLVTQRVDMLMDLALIERMSDPRDGRRKILVLTTKGIDQCARLKTRMVQVADAFVALYDEIECDLAAIATRAIDALERVPILDRINSMRCSSSGDMPDHFERSKQ